MNTPRPQSEKMKRFFAISEKVNAAQTKAETSTDRRKKGRYIRQANRLINSRMNLVLHNVIQL